MSGVGYIGRPVIPPPLVLDVRETSQLLILVDGTKMTNASSSLVKRVRITPPGLPATTVAITLAMGAASAAPPRSSTAIKTDDIWKLSRLSWLDSKVGVDSSITHPYMTITLDYGQDKEAPTLTC